MNTAEVWVIRHKKTGELWKAASGKSSWKKAAHAKNAWANTCQYVHYLQAAGIPPVYEETSHKYKRLINYYFDDQNIYELVNFNQEVESISGKATKACEDVYMGIHISELKKYPVSVQIAWKVGKSLRDEKVEKA
jgi:hypothetical protein